MLDSITFARSGRRISISCWLFATAIASSPGGVQAQQAAAPIPESFDLKAQSAQQDAVFGWTMAMGRLGAPGHDLYDDIVISAFGETVGGASQAGAGYVFMGPTLTPTSPTQLIPATTPQAGIQMGLLRIGIGDTRGGQSNLIFLPTWTLSGSLTSCGTANRGAVQIFDGASSTLPASQVEPPNVTSSCGVMAFGHSVATGDVDGDGIDDLVVGAHSTNGVGRVYVFSGYSGFATPPFQAVWRAIDPLSSFAASEFGVEVVCSDLDGDGYAEVIVGQSERTTGKGKVFIYRGTDVAAISANSLSTTLAPVEILQDPNLANGDVFGWQIYAIRDVGSTAGTFDHLPDVAIYSEYSQTSPSALRGKLYVFFNNTNGPGSASFVDETNYAGLVAPTGTTYVSGQKARFGRGAASIDWPDTNGVSHRGLVIGEEGGPTAAESGRAYLAYGPFGPSSGAAKTTHIVNSWATTLLNPNPGSNAHFGACVVTGRYSTSYVGDQIIISAREATVGGQTRAGHAYAFHP